MIPSRVESAQGGAGAPITISRNSPLPAADDPATVGGLPARVQGVEITERTIGFAPGHRLVLYVVELPDGDYLVAETYAGPDLQSARSVLDDMMRTIQIELP